MSTWHVDCGDTSVTAWSVTAWSVTRLPFEPRGEMLEYRGALRQALRALRARPGAGLVATYSSPNEEFVDEYVALYNVGLGAYAHLTATGLYCERQPSPGERHHLHYRVDDLPKPPGSEVLACVTAPVPTDVHSPGSWWTAFRPTVEAQRHEYLGPFTVDVALAGQWHRPALAGVVKPMLDGLVSALHVHDGGGRDLLAPRLVPLGEPDELWPALCDTSRNVLGARALIRAHGTRLAWNPADERCNAFRVRAVPGPRPLVAADVRSSAA